MTVEPVCEKCGQPHIIDWGKSTGQPSCTGHSYYETIDGQRVPRAQLKPCSNWPMHGQQVCRAHGGMAPQSRAKARERTEQQEAERIMAKYAEIDPAADPGDILFDLIVHGHAAVKFFRHRVEAIADETPDDLVWGMTKDATGGKDKGKTYEAKPNAWLALLQTAERDLARNCVDALKVGLKQRELDIAARMADLLLPLVDSVVKALGHDPDAPDIAEVIQLALRTA